MKEIGKIYGDVIDDEFSFVSKSFFDGDYVKITEDDGAEIICQIGRRNISNRYLETPQAIRYLTDDMDIEQDTLYTYQAFPIGVVKDGEVVSRRVNAFPGRKVFSVDSDSLQTVYGIPENGIEMGYLKKMPVCKIRLNMDILFQPHLFVVGKTGAGKTYFMKKILQELETPFWVFAPSDEYDDLVCQGLSVYDDVILYLDIESLVFYLGLNATEEAILRKLSFDTNSFYTGKDLRKLVYEYYAKKAMRRPRQISFDFGDEENNDVELPTYANTLSSKLRLLSHLKFSFDRKKTKLPSRSVVFDMSRYTQLEQECMMNYYLYRLMFQCRGKRENSKKHIVVIEEAHNYLPSTQKTQCKDIIVKLAREGRKHGIFLCFITQRPRYFDQTALSQSGSKVIFSLPHPDDVKHITEEVAYYRQSFPRDIPRQRQGECMVIGDALRDVVEMVVSVGEK